MNRQLSIKEYQEFLDRPLDGPFDEPDDFGISLVRSPTFGDYSRQFTQQRDGPNTLGRIFLSKE